jgi:hypothetical protein
MTSRFKFKAWDKAKKLLTRPGTVNFVRGELIIPDSIILQFTGCTDKLEQEIYEEDILLIGEQKHRVYWDEKEQTWKYYLGSQTFKLSQQFTQTTIRGYNAYEKGEQEN